MARLIDGVSPSKDRKIAEGLPSDAKSLSLLLYVMATPITCPICKTENDFFAEPVGPFCSNRCKMIDLGQWLGEDYRISEPLRADHLDDYADLSGLDLDIPEN